MYSIRLNEIPMPTGSREPEVLLDWLLDSMGLIRRRKENGTLQRVMRDALLSDPLRGWDSQSLGEATGMSHTALHLQVRKLRQAGLLSTETSGKWQFHVLRGGSMSASVTTSTALASTVLSLRMEELARLVEPSDTRMEAPAEEDETSFSIRVTEAGPRKEGVDDVASLVRDLGLSGDSEKGVPLARGVLMELCSSHHPVTLLALSERLSESRGRVNTTIQRMRSAGLVETVPMVSRLAQDIFGALTRQHSGRGTEWLMGRGGLSRIDEAASSSLVNGLESGSLDIQGVEGALSSVPLEGQRILLNTLGGRMPFGYRVSGADGKAVSERVTRLADRSLRRIRTIAQRLDEAYE